MTSNQTEVSLRCRRRRYIYGHSSSLIIYLSKADVYSSRCNIHIFIIVITIISRYSYIYIMPKYLHHRHSRCGCAQCIVTSLCIVIDGIRFANIVSSSWNINTYKDPPKKSDNSDNECNTRC